MASSRLAQAGDAGDIVVDEATRRVARHAAIVEPAAVGSESAFRVVGLEFGNDGRQASGRFDSEMVGRERERRRLLDAFEQATSDRSCQLFTILGPAGVGKSRLVREFLRDVNATGDRRDRPLPPVRRRDHLLAHRSRWSRTSQAWTTPTRRSKAGSGSPRCSKAIDEQDTLVERLAETIGSSTAVAAVDESSRAVRTLFAAVASQRPLVVVFDDIHWGETTFLDLVEEIAETVAGRAAPAPLHGPAGAHRRSARLGRRQAERDLRAARAALRQPSARA